jgi:hypothetical protein
MSCCFLTSIPKLITDDGSIHDPTVPKKVHFEPIANEDAPGISSVTKGDFLGSSGGA